MKNIIRKMVTFVTNKIKKHIENFKQHRYLRMINPYILDHLSYDSIQCSSLRTLKSTILYFKSYNSNKEIHKDLSRIVNNKYDKIFVENIIRCSKYVFDFIVEDDIDFKHTQRYYAIKILDSGYMLVVRQHNFGRLVKSIMMNSWSDDPNNLLFFLDNHTDGFYEFLKWLKIVSTKSKNRFEYDSEDDTIILEKESDKSSNINDNILNDIGVDLSTEEVELSSNSTEFNIKLNRLMLATEGIENEECNSGYYIIRKVLDSFYTISGLNTLLSLDDEHGEYILCTKDQIIENILPPTQFFAPVAA